MDEALDMIQELEKVPVTIEILTVRILIGSKF